MLEAICSLTVRAHLAVQGFDAFESRRCGVAGLLTLWLDRSPTCSSRLAWPVALSAAVTLLAFVLEAFRKVRRRRKKRGA